MPGYSDPGFDTPALHAGAAPDPATGARAVPIHLTTCFVFESSEHAASLFNVVRSGHVYSRISNPTNAVLEERIDALEGGSGAIDVARGQAALHLAIATLAGAGSHLVTSSALFGGSHNLLHYLLGASASTPPSSSRATSTAGAARSARTPSCGLARRWATPGWTCSTSPP
jgi:O-acetylhomoserine (thiol)-lyase